MCYRELTPEQASAVMDYCEANGMDYDIWNAADVWFGADSKVELGTDWDRVPKELYL